MEKCHDDAKNEEEITISYNRYIAKAIACLHTNVRLLVKIRPLDLAEKVFAGSNGHGQMMKLTHVGLSPGVASVRLSKVQL